MTAAIYTDLPEQFQHETAGVVHSVYSDVINLSFPGTTLITLLGPQYTQVPDAVGLKAEALELLNGARSGDCVTLSLQMADFAKQNCRLVFGNAKQVHSFLAPSHMDKSRILVQEIDNYEKCCCRCGSIGRMNEATAQKMLRSMKALVQSVILNDFEMLLSSLDSAVGIGIGLTPSFDDGLIGVAAAAFAYGKGALFLRKKEALFKTIQSKTTDVSLRYLHAAFEGRFSQTIRALFNNDKSCAAVACAVHAVAKTGSTSGRDTLWGVREMLHAWLGMHDG